MINRRAFLQMNAFLALNQYVRSGVFRDANAQSTADYRALVCIFLGGGNDSNNMIIPFTDREYSQYISHRKHLALRGSALTPAVVSLDGAPYTFNSAMPDVARLFNSRKLAVVANVGSLVRRITREQLLQQPSHVPQLLFSHPDQTALWQGVLIGNDGIPTGWSGRVADTIVLNNPNSSTLSPFMSINERAIQGVGRNTIPYSLAPGIETELYGFSNARSGDAKWTELNGLLKNDSGLLLVQAANNSMTKSLTGNAMLNSVLTRSRGVNTQFPNTQLGKSLQEIANVINARNELGMRRQIFYCLLPGFDTHEDQLGVHWHLLNDLNNALSAFYNATIEMGVSNQVITFTESEFNRTFRPTSTGSDHAWGGHQLVVGGPVRGGQVVGQFPTFELGGADDFDTSGRWIPSISVVQYAATLARWFGLSETELLSVFPTLPNFGVHDLGFTS